MSIPTFETERLMLRPFTLEDAPRVQSLAGDPEVAKTTLTIPHPYADGVAEEWISKHASLAERGHYPFAICLKDAEHTLIGCISIGTHPHYHRAEIGYWIGVDYWSKGYGTEAAKRVIQFGFEELKQNKIWAAAFTFNPGSSKIMEKIGMSYEGTFRDHVIKNGEYQDLAYYGILRSEWELNHASKK